MNSRHLPSQQLLLSHPDMVSLRKEAKPTEVRISVTVEWELVQNEKYEFLELLNSKMNIAGFRRGKAPSRRLISQYGTVSFFEELRNRIEKVVFEHQIQKSIPEIESPLTTPEFEHGEIVEGEPYEFTVNWPIDPRAVLEQAQQQGMSPDGHAPEMPGAGPTGGPQSPTPQIHSPNSHDVPGPPDVGPNMPGGIPRPPGFDPYR